MRISIKPLSVNECWRGRRFKTKEYKNYEKELSALIPKFKAPDGELYLKVQFGFSSKSSDIDNPLKPFIDILQKKTLFNDKMIRKLAVSTTYTKKGAEFIRFKLVSYDREMDENSWL